MFHYLCAYSENLTLLQLRSITGNNSFPKIIAHLLAMCNYRMEGNFGGGKCWRMTINSPKFLQPTFPIAIAYSNKHNLFNGTTPTIVCSYKAM